MLNKDLEKLNSITKYPSIYTYHKLGNRGGLEEEVLCPVSESLTGYVTEKIDGTNSRIIFYKDDYIIGSREQLLYAKGDRIINDSMHVVEKLKDVAEEIVTKVNNLFTEDVIVVIYGEVYGKNIGRECKNYTDGKELGYRAFDISVMTKEEYSKELELDLPQISTNREKGAHFINFDFLNDVLKLFTLQTVPILGSVDISKLPKDIEGMHKMIMDSCFYTKAGLDNQGIAEGIIIRSSDRKYIRKIRLQEYEKTLGIKRKK